MHRLFAERHYEHAFVRLGRALDAVVQLAAGVGKLANDVVAPAAAPVECLLGRRTI
jgi:hypothetical protein